MLLLSLGSNLSSSYGDRFKNLEIAIACLEESKIEIIKKSSYYETPSYPNKNDPKFINIIIKAKTSLNPPELASTLIFIEEKLERKRGKKNDPRTCDIDIIDFNNQVIDFSYQNLNFTVPHKKLSYRNFVLYPLKEVFPDWKHPITNEPINDLIKKLNTIDKKSILKIKKY